MNLRQIKRRAYGRNKQEHFMRRFCSRIVLRMVQRACDRAYMAVARAILRQQQEFAAMFLAETEQLLAQEAEKGNL